jgi:rhamnose utilization protein RhaD (predicted bifunctional aldolase and dehydrogenase)
MSSAKGGKQVGVKDLAEITNRYGQDKEFVLAGGGNTSFKDGSVMYVKPSGTSMADIGPDDFVRMDLGRLKDIMERRYPQDSAAREAQALEDLMNARVQGEPRRPSVETLLHALLPHTYVVHTHPALVNGLTCSEKGAEIAEELFGNQALWVPVVNPGYVLARTISDMLQQHQAAGGGNQIIFLQNHGLFIQADTLAEIDGLYDKVIFSLSGRIGRFPVQGFTVPDGISEEAVADMVSGDTELMAAGALNADLEDYLQDSSSFAPLSLSFTPDHIVYCGFKPLYCDRAKGLSAAFREYTADCKVPPKIVAVKGVGIFGLGTSKKAAELAREVFLDGVRIAVYTESFGGHKFMPQDKIDFIRNWEVEQYRSSVSGG